MTFPPRLILTLAGSSLLAVSFAKAQTTYTWANSNVTNTPATLDWFTGGPNTQGAWTGGTPVSSNLNTIRFFSAPPTAVPNTTTVTQGSNLNNGGTAFQLATLTLSGQAPATSNMDLAMSVTGDALNFSDATGTIILDSVDVGANGRNIFWSVGNAIQLGTAGSSSQLTLTGNGSSAFNFSGSLSELQSGGGGKLIKSGSSTTTLSGAITVSGGIEVNGGVLRLTNGSNSIAGGITLNGGSFGDNTGTISTATLNNNLITVNGGASLGLTGGATTNGGITLNSGANLTFATNNSSATINGAVTGVGSISINRLGAGSHTQNLNSTANTFTGTVSFTAASTATLSVNSLADSASLGAGNIRFAGSAGTSAHTFALGSGAVAPVTLNNRRVEIVSGSSATYTIANNSPQPFTINTDLLVGAGGSPTLTLKGTGTGLSSFNGLVANGSATSIGLTKSDGGTWVLGGSANTYTGATTISGGTLVVSKMADYGADSSIGRGTSGTSIAMGSAASLVYTGTGDDTNRSIDFTAAGFNAANSVNILNNGTGALNFTATQFNTGSNNANNRYLTLGGTHGGTISGAIRDTGNDSGGSNGYIQLIKNGTGTWTMAGSNDYIGSTDLNAGTLKLDYSTNNNSKLGDVTTVGFLRLNGGTLEFSGGSHVETVLSTTLNTGGTFIKQSSGASTLQMGGITFTGGAVDFSADNIATTTTANNAAGILNVRATVAGANFAMKSGSNIVAYDYATSGVTGYTGAAMVANTNYELTANGASTLSGTTGATSNTLKIANTSTGSLAVGTSTLTVGAILFAGSANYDLTTSGTGRITPSVLHNYGTSGAVLNLGALGGALTQFGTGTTVLTSPAQANAGVTVNGGTVQFSANNQLGTPSNGAGITLNNGTLRASTSGGDIALNNSGANSRNVTLGAGGGTLDITGGGTLTVSGAISGAGNRLTIGSASSNGTIALTGTNTYSGGTTVSAGTLLVNGAHTGGGLITVSAGATLGGTGTMGDVTVGDLGVLAPGTSPGQMTVGNLTLNDTSVLRFELGAPTLVPDPGFSDHLVVNGHLTLNGRLQITPLAGFPGAPLPMDKWLLMSYSGTLTDNTLELEAPPPGGYYIDTATEGSVFLAVVVPEAGAATLFGLGVLVIGLIRRRQ